ncbi:MAG TPA: AEC family transporter [Firmicutes bacterium]|nr:AEC family transporter [Bacillota bacterium]
MDNKIITTQVLIFAVMMFIGFLARKKRTITPEVTKGLSDVLINITSPLMVFTSFQFTYTSDMLRSAGKVFVFSLFIHLFSLLLGLVIYNMYPKPSRTILRFITVFSNCGFMGLPLLQAIYGRIGVFYGSIYLTVFNLLLWTVGVVIFTGKQRQKSWGRDLLNPNIIGVVLGLATFALSIKIPSPVYSALELVGGMTTPLSMLVIGSLLAGVGIRDLFSGSALYYGTFIRLVVIPGLTLLITSLYNLTPILQGVCVLCAAAPAASLTAIFAEKHNGDALFASRIIFFSTVLSLFTLPLFLLLVG